MAIDSNSIKEEQRPYVFNPNDHVMQIKNKGGSSDYLPVQWRIVWFRSICPEGEITTELVHLELDRETEEETFAWNSETRRSEKVVKRANGFAMFRATVKDGKGGIATGTKSEKAASFPDYIEKAETGAIGRALAALGYGTQFAPELNEEHRLADAPLDRSTKAEPVVHPSRHTQAASKDQDEQPAPDALSVKDVLEVDEVTKALNKAKARAQFLEIPPEQWQEMKQRQNIVKFETLLDVAKMNGELTAVEKARTPVQRQAS